MNATKGQVRAWARLGQRATFFGVAMPELAKTNSDLMVITADLAQLSNLNRFSEQYPDKFINVGIAEQNMIGVSAGLAMEGYLVYATTYASFIAVRDLEHVRQHLSNLNLNVKLIGTAAGVVAARSGVAHWASEDIAFMRALPGMTVISAADCIEAYEIAKYSAVCKGPMYIRLSGAPNCPIVYDERYEFVPERISIINKGEDVAIIGTGLMVYEALEAAKILKNYGVSCTVGNMHTIKPIDKETIKELFDNHKLVFTIEEHNIIGGMGSAVAEYKSTLSVKSRQILLGFPDSFTEAGNPRYIWKKFGLTAELIAERVIEELKAE